MISEDDMCHANPSEGGDTSHAPVGATSPGHPGDALTICGPLGSDQGCSRCERCKAEALLAEAKFREMGLRDRVAELTAALKPFAEVKTSSFFSSDGSEEEGYDIFIADRAKCDIRGGDFARAREVLKAKPECEDEA